MGNEKLIGSYEVIKQISEGGFARIYQARHILLDEVACKRRQDVELLRKEAILLWKLDGDELSLSFPEKTPKPIVNFCNRLLRHNPMDRPNWDKEDLLETFSDIRYEVFGRRHNGGN